MADILNAGRLLKRSRGGQGVLSTKQREKKE